VLYVLVISGWLLDVLSMVEFFHIMGLSGRKFM
jgi:hypothetical protein